MLDIFKSKSDTPAKAGDEIIQQQPGQIFTWRKGVILTALDAAIIALPMSICGRDKKVESVVLGPADMKIIPPKSGGDIFHIRLEPGMSVSLAKACQARVVSEDKQFKKFKISKKPVPKVD